LFDSFVTGMPHVRDGKLRALAVTSAKRSALAPELPTVAETLPGFESVTWFGLYGPKNLPSDLVSKINASVNAALADSDVKERFARLGAEPAGGTPQAFEAMVKRDAGKWKKIITERKLSVE
jgi:tripartite-type tricarboxylate transporter receptor subunit TctC